jgi:hypothetical protein
MDIAWKDKRKQNTQGIRRRKKKVRGVGQKRWLRAASY